MGGDVETIKERLDIAEVVGSYVKLEKAGQSFKARCPFHNEKTPSFFVSPSRQSYYCFGCGAKGDIFTFVEQTEGLDFKEALKILADRAGVELKKFSPQNKAEQSEKERILEALEEAAKFFAAELNRTPEARKYLQSRGIKPEIQTEWQLGFAKDEWRFLKDYLNQVGYTDEILFKAGLVKKAVDSPDKSPYDVFRGRIIFPLKDQSGTVIAFSGRALSKDTEPKYLNSPDTIVFKKHEVLYGFDKAKDKIRRRDYAVLVEGQIDLVMSHQAGVDNTVASSGTAFTQAHLERLKKLSKRIILAFDGDKAGTVATEKSAALAMALGLETKVARLPEGKDPAEIAKENQTKWKDILRKSLPAIEHFLNLVLEEEKDARKAGLAVRSKILPLVVLLESSIERSHFVSLIAKKTGIKEDIIWDDLKKTKRSEFQRSDLGNQYLRSDLNAGVKSRPSRSDEYHEVTALLKENPGDKDLMRHKEELSILMRIDKLDEKMSHLRLNIKEGDDKTLAKIAGLARKRDEERRKMR